MKKIILSIIAICCLLLSYYSGKQVAYHDDDVLIQDLYELSLYSEELLDMYYEKYPDFWNDTIINTESFQEYHNLQTKLLGPN